jgi:hypothetical protein
MQNFFATKSLRAIQGQGERQEITNAMEQNPSSKANNHSTSQEIPYLLQNQKVY